MTAQHVSPAVDRTALNMSAAIHAAISTTVAAHEGSDQDIGPIGDLATLMREAVDGARNTWLRRCDNMASGR